jgi:TolB-like protein
MFNKPKNREQLSALSIFFSGFILALILNFTITAQGDEKNRLAEAEKYYKSALYDKAIKILSELSFGKTSSNEVQKDALRFLSRAYVAKGYYDKAKESLAKLLELEPPLVTLNPDFESPPLMRLYYEVRKSSSGDSYTVERPDPGMKTMAIIDFQNSSIDEKEKFDPMEKGFADLMIHRLNNSVGLKVIERDRINWILNEIEIQDKYSMEGAVRLGKQLGVHTVLLGSFIIYNDEIWLGARLVKVETSEILLTDEIKGDLEDFFSLTEKLSNKITDKIDVTLKAAADAVTSETKSLEALLTYSEGLSLLEEGNYREAYNKFLKALEYDPKYELARTKAESIKPLVG